MCDALGEGKRTKGLLLDNGRRKQKNTSCLCQEGGYGREACALNGLWGWALGCEKGTDCVSFKW